MVLFHFILLSIPMLFSQGLRGEQRKSQKFMKYLRLLLLHQYFLPLRIKQKGMDLNAVWGHVSPDGLLVPSTALSSIILLSMENKKNISVIPSEKSEDPGIERMRQVIKHMVIQVCFPPLKGSEP